ncbi:hypothetical protein [Arenibaculum sp.]|uniref:hypothetical protein n=1 Tax=Arenibaculum sp. TaxID=2865862 RepID=UPI002E0EA70E|nr:hypothetical protein [Arenibaculum sp.]
MERAVHLTDEEFDDIEETISRSAKGRAFLRRFARRAQGAATEEIREVLGGLRSILTNQQGVASTAQHLAVLRRELLEMAGSIEKARREVAALKPPDNGNNKILTATNELDAIVTSTERASFDILNSAERLMELTTRLRRSGADEQLCGDMEAEITSIFTACSFQDLTGQRTSKVINALRYIEHRISAMIQIWGIEGISLTADAADGELRDGRPDAHLLSGPALPGQGVSQADVDALFAGLDAAPEEVEAEPEPEDEPVAAAPPPPPPAQPKAAKPKAAAPQPKAPTPEPAQANPQPLDQSAIDALFG